MLDDIDGRSAAQEWICGASGWRYEKRHPKSSDRERQSEARGASHLCKSKLNSNHPIRSIVAALGVSVHRRSIGESRLGRS